MTNHSNKRKTDEGAIMRGAERLLDLLLRDAQPDAQNATEDDMVDGGRRPLGKYRQRAGDDYAHAKAKKPKKESYGGELSTSSQSSQSERERETARTGVWSPGNAHTKVCRLTVEVAGRGRAPLAEPESSVVTPEPQVQQLSLWRQTTTEDGEDEIDGLCSSGPRDLGEDMPDQSTKSATSNAADEISKEDDEIISKIASELRKIGDNCDEEVKRKLGAASISRSDLMSAAKDLIADLSYEQFQKLVQNLSQTNEPCVQQLMTVFQLAKATALVAKSAKEVVSRLNTTVLRYMEGIAPWMSQNGGWRVVAEDMGLD